MHGFACVFLPHFLQIAPRPAWPERVSATALKPSHKAGGRGGESTARDFSLKVKRESHGQKYIFRFSKNRSFVYIIQTFSFQPSCHSPCFFETDTCHSHSICTTQISICLIICRLTSKEQPH
ncbi:hypothetical protein GHA11_04370 [Escherichia coli]|nr:hypothetical protein [Escherichia coli]